jgi:hypothetical protein
MPTRLEIRCCAAGVIALGLAGCTAEVNRYVRFPEPLNPGWAQEQRREAIEHDPYPLNDVGPEIVGGRPREYLQPVNEVERAQMYAPRPAALQPIPIPALPPASAAPVVSAPYPAAPFPNPPVQVQPRSPY